jgi:Leucine-rich repeat (LRR) protein
VREIPQNISNLTKLIKFTISNNNIIILPKEILLLTELKELDVSNHGEEYDEEYIQMNQDSKYVNSLKNEITTIPIEIINCRNLKYISFSNNEIILNPIIERFINRMNNINNHNLYKDGQNVHTSTIQQSVRESIINLLKDTY